MGNKNKQQIVDQKAISEHKAVGSDNPGGQDKIDPQRFIPNAQDGANSPKKKFRGVRIHDEGPDTWGMNKVPRYEHD